jgi:hypothetical protein
MDLQRVEKSLFVKLNEFNALLASFLFGTKRKIVFSRREAITILK